MKTFILYQNDYELNRFNNITNRYKKLFENIIYFKSHIYEILNIISIILIILIILIFIKNIQK